MGRAEAAHARRMGARRGMAAPWASGPSDARAGTLDERSEEREAAVSRARRALRAGASDGEKRQQRGGFVDAWRPNNWIRTDARVTVLSNI